MTCICAGSSACTDCGSGKYSAAFGATTSSTCSSCPSGSSSPSGSDSASHCTCNRGFSGPGGGPCTVAATTTTPVLHVNASRLRELNATWGSPEVSHCVLGQTMRDLRRSGATYRTGGLGHLIQPQLYEVWVCVEGATSCQLPSHADAWFCWVINEEIALSGETAPAQYVAWDHNAHLKILT